MKLKLLLTITLLNLITACTTLPKHIVVSPELIGYSKGVYFDKRIQLNVIDQRTGSQVVQIIEDGEPAKILSSQESLTNIVNNAISPVFRKQGITIDPFANIQVDIIIDTALISVQQSLVNYTAKNTISLNVSVSNSNTVTTKSFNTTGSSAGPLVADIAVLERDFNHQLASLLVRIINSNEIQSAIKQQTNNSDTF
ncbi:YajG family lipoprotein [Colwellia sp. UCD-KL20]|uniref:YajG family lipoprotein n=1 Tax=Colwellia sp. UCD-KL20 TaxID=1917165 RepID=UPI000970C7C2|nr:YajG family lipoprotein [Colwellia sp. UCD-KL20]